VLGWGGGWCGGGGGGGGSGGGRARACMLQILPTLMLQMYLSLIIVGNV